MVIFLVTPAAARAGLPPNAVPIVGADAPNAPAASAPVAISATNVIVVHGSPFPTGRRRDEGRVHRPPSTGGGTTEGEARRGLCSEDSELSMDDSNLCNPSTKVQV